MSGKLFKKPAGETQIGWCTERMGTCSSMVCEACGTEHPDISPYDRNYHLSRILGLRIIDECCGKAIDVLYEELGEEFCLRFLDDFAGNPGNLKYASLIRAFEPTLAKAKQTLEDDIGRIDGAEELLKDVSCNKGG